MLKFVRGSFPFLLKSLTLQIHFYDAMVEWLLSYYDSGGLQSKDAPEVL